MPTGTKIKEGFIAFGRMGNSPQLRFIKILSTMFAPIGGFITIVFCVVYMYEWAVYLAGVEKMDIFEAIPMEYKIIAIVLGVSLLILDYLKKYFEATENKEATKFDSAYLLSMICSVAVGGLASYIVVFQITGAFLDMEITSTIMGVLIIAGLSALTCFVIDRVLFHQMGDVMYQSKKRKAKKAPVKETAGIVQSVIAQAEKLGMCIKDPSMISKAIMEALTKNAVDDVTQKKKNGKDFDPYKE